MASKLPAHDLQLQAGPCRPVLCMPCAACQGSSDDKAALCASFGRFGQNADGLQVQQPLVTTLLVVVIQLRRALRAAKPSTAD